MRFYLFINNHEITSVAVAIILATILYSTILRCHYIIYEVYNEISVRLTPILL